MLRTERLSHNPIQYLQSLPKKDNERPRRALLENEVIALLTATIGAGKHHGQTGYERSLVYRFALETGLRYDELRMLKWGDIVTSGDIPHIKLRGEYAKNKKADEIPFTPELAKDLKQYFKENLAMPHIRAFRLWKNAGAKMIKEDLELAGIQYQTEAGFADFHALRHTHITLNSLSGNTQQIVQKMARHSDPSLTSNYYTHVTLEDKFKALKNLPKMQPKKHKQALVTCLKIRL